MKPVFGLMTKVMTNETLCKGSRVLKSKKEIIYDYLKLDGLILIFISKKNTEYVMYFT